MDFIFARPSHYFGFTNDLLPIIVYGIAYQNREL